MCLFNYVITRKRTGKLFPNGVFFDFLLYGIVSGVVAAFMLGLIATNEEKLISTTTLVSMKDTRVEKGSWFILIGNTSSTPYYEYYTKVNDVYILDRVNADRNNIVITEKNNSEYVLKIYKTVVTQDYKKWTISFDSNNKYHFYVPEGTLKKEFHLS